MKNVLRKVIKFVWNIIFILPFFFPFKIIVSQAADANEMINLNFHGKTLPELIQSIADIKGINILMPNEFNQSTVKINFSIPTEIPLSEIEEYLLYFLTMAGYFLYAQEGVFIVTKKSVELLQRAPLPLYVDIPPEELPNNNGYIRAIYFLKHIKVPVKNDDPLKNILFELIPDGGQSILIDPKSNAIIFKAAPANAIASVMTILLKIDEYGIKDEVAVLPLKHTSVNVIGPIVQSLIDIAKESTLEQISNSYEYDGASYFSPQTKIVRDIRNNAIIFLGKQAAIDKLIQFIQTELDVPVSDGKNVIHIYDLQYLDARKIAPILQNLVNGRQQSGQSVKEGGASTIYRAFEGVRILAEEQTREQAKGSSGEKQEQAGIILGGNRLLIAATEDDFKEIKKILQQIDKCQPQIIIEAMFLDLEIDEFGNFSSQTRLPSIFNLPAGVGLQAIMMDGSQVVINDPTQNPNSVITNAGNITPSSTLNSDLLGQMNQSQGNNFGSQSTVGSKSLIEMTSHRGIVISLAESFASASIASILNLEEGARKKNIIANPYGITQNNQNLVMQNVQTRRARGALNEANTQQTVIKIDKYDASLNVSITPRINFGSIEDEHDKTIINLEIQITVEEFSSANSADVNKFNRAIATAANIHSGDLLVLGGLYKHSFGKTISKTPLLGDIPIIGNFFRGAKNEKSDSNLIIVLRATVVNDALMRKFTLQKVQEKYSAWDKNIALGKLNDKITEIKFKDLIDQSPDAKLCTSRVNNKENMGNIMAKDIASKGDHIEPFFTNIGLREPIQQNPRQAAKNKYNNSVEIGTKKVHNMIAKDNKESNSIQQTSMHQDSKNAFNNDDGDILKKDTVAAQKDIPTKIQNNKKFMDNFDDDVRQDAPDAGKKISSLYQNVSLPLGKK